MTQTPLDLDTAIDAVAKRLTHVEHDPHLPVRIASSLPERSSWFLHSWIPRLALTAALAIAATLVVLRPFDGRSTDVLRTAVVSSPIIEFAASAPENRTTVERLNDRRTAVERPENELRTIETPDFERSLPSLSAVASLDFDSVAPVSLPEDAPLTLAPLAIADLPLTAESISPR